MSGGFTITGCNAHCLANGCALSQTLERIEEAAAFLDGQAKRMWVRGEQKSAEECREMAEKLRGGI